jgi:phospholipase C
MRRLLDRLRRKLRQMTGGEEPQPDRALDRWLLRVVIEDGPWTAAEFVRSRHALGAGPPDPPGGPKLPRLTSGQCEQWLEGAFNRGLLTTRATRLSGLALAPPQVVVTDAGLARLAEVQPRGGAVATARRLAHRRQLAHEEREDWTRAAKALPDVPLAHEEPRPLLPGERPIEELPPAPDEDAGRRLARIEHIVVVMMENRSFDHMLGYLRLWGHEHVEGLRGAESQTWQGIPYGVAHLGDTRLPKVADPCHCARCVAEQLDEAQGGFPGNFGRTRRLNPGYVMGYYTGDDLPVYDHLARTFCVCDHWFSSVPGATWPNRLYSLAGLQDGHRESLFGGGFLFDVPTFVRMLPADVKCWRWYSHDPATLRLVDGQFRPRHDGGEWTDPHRAHFRFFDRRKVSDVTQRDERLVVDEGSSFLDDAAAGDLAAVSWIDPNFVDLSVRDPSSADDHPPSDVRAGQQFILDVYRAVVTSPCWESTMLVIVYDEHGGFYDHCRPPRLPGGRGTFGVRVPALVVSPHVGAGVVSKTQFDHTSLIRTILERFAPAALDEMPERVRQAAHLGHVLSDQPRADRPDLRALDVRMAARRGPARPPGPRPEEQRPTIADFPADVAQGARHLRENGLPAAHP